MGQSIWASQISSPDGTNKSVQNPSDSISTPQVDSGRGGNNDVIPVESPVQSTMEPTSQPQAAKPKYKNPRLPSIPTRPPSMRILAKQLNQDSSNHSDKPA